jgi:hypothetical protein
MGSSIGFTVSLFGTGASANISLTDTIHSRSWTILALVSSVRRIVPDPLCRPSDRVVFQNLEDFDLAANLQLIWLRNNDSALLKDFRTTTHHVAIKLQPFHSESKCV